MQATLGRRQGRRRIQSGSDSLLLGRIHDAVGNVMTPTHAQKGPRRYRYYVSQAVLQGREAGPIRRIPAPEIEAAVLEALRSRSPDASGLDDAELVQRTLAACILHPDRLVLRLAHGDDLELPWSFASTRRRREIVLPVGAPTDLRPMKAEDRARILKATAMARAWMADLTIGRIDGPSAIGHREHLSERSVRMTSSLAFLSPAIVRAIIDGRLPRGIAIRDLAELPVAWFEQDAMIGV